MKSCLTEEQLMELYYQESNVDLLKEHLAACDHCQNQFYQFCSDMIELEFNAPDAGYQAVNDALKTIVTVDAPKQEEKIMTVEEVAHWLRVEPHNIFNMLHLLPHFVVDSNIRFRQSAVSGYIKQNEAGADKSVPVRLLHNLNQGRSAA